jgi:SAM-dependent methyltransferase
MDARLRLDEMARGYQHAVVLLTAVKTGLFAAMGREPWAVGALAKKTRFDLRALDVTLHALAAEGVLLKENDIFRLDPEFAPFLLPDSPETQASILSHNHSCMKRWVHLDRTLRTGRPVPEAAGPRDAVALRDFICGMANISRGSSLEVAAKVDFSKFGRLLDLGGGPGTSSIVFATRYPGLRCVVFDLKETIAIARKEIAKAGVGDRVKTRAGDYFRDEFGRRFDAVYVSNIIHSLSPDDTRMLFEKSRRAMNPGGTVIVKDFFLDDSRTAPLSAALFSINMLTATEGGKSYTWTETQELLAAAGFGRFERMPVAMASGLLIARAKS